MKALEKQVKVSQEITPARQLINHALARIASKQTERLQPMKGRLVVILDLTGSRKRTLQHARVSMAAMFDTIKRLASIAVKLIYYRGDECKETAWESDPDVVSRAMARLSCEVGGTQIARALRRALELEKEQVSGVVFIGDHCEDDPEQLAQLAGALGEKRIPIFVFHECQDNNQHALMAKPVFKRIAEVSNGIYAEFELESAQALRELLSSVAAFSTAGIEGIQQVGSAVTPQAQQLQRRLLLLAAGPDAND
jgi:hypothetical protein